MKKYHITDEGEVKECSASSEETCKYGGEHFADISKAYEKADEINKEKTKTFNTLSKASNIEEFKQAIKDMGINYKSSKFITKDGNIVYYDEFIEDSLYNAGKYFNENFKDFKGYKYNPHNKIDFDENYEDISEDLEYYIKDMLNKNNTDNTYFENKKYGFKVDKKHILDKYKEEAYPDEEIEDYVYERYILREEVDLSNYSDVSAIDVKKVQKESNNVYKNFNEKEKQIIDYYTGAGYEQINDMLREGDKELIKSQLDTLDKIVNKDMLHKDIKAYRGTQLKYFEDLRAGDVFKSPVYMSTSLLEEVSEDFLNEDEGEVVLIEINAKKGTKGLYIGSNTSYRDEHEFLLPRNSEFKVVEVIEDYSWYPKIVVEAV